MSKVVLVSKSGYDEKYDELLSSFLDREFELFCVVGKNCEKWEEVMDEIAVGDGANSRYIITTSHPNESELEVIEFAKNFVTETKSEVEVVRI